jgi:hypothetical protein
MDYRQQMAGKTDADVEKELATLTENDGPLAAERAKVVDTPAGKLIIKELKQQLGAILREYSAISVLRHSNVVQADLANMQGKEEEVRKLLYMWLHAKEEDKKVDINIRICQVILKDRRKNADKRRIGHG